MSPVDDGQKRVWRDADGYLRDERGLKSMAHLAVLMVLLLAWVVALVGAVALFFKHADAATLIVAALGLAGTAAGLEGVQTHVEGRNQRAER